MDEVLVWADCHAPATLVQLTLPHRKRRHSLVLGRSIADRGPAVPKNEAKGKSTHTIRLLSFCFLGLLGNILCDLLGNVLCDLLGNILCDLLGNILGNILFSHKYFFTTLRTPFVSSAFYSFLLKFVAKNARVFLLFDGFEQTGNQ